MCEEGEEKGGSIILWRNSYCYCALWGRWEEEGGASESGIHLMYSDGEEGRWQPVFLLPLFVLGTDHEAGRRGHGVCAGVGTETSPHLPHHPIPQPAQCAWPSWPGGGNSFINPSALDPSDPSPTL